MSNLRRRKHVQDVGSVLSPIDNEPGTKRLRISSSGHPIPRSTITHQQAQEGQSQHPIRRGKQGKRKREEGVDGEPEVDNDENQFNDLEESLKRLRIRRPIIFLITSFVEQSVDSVTYNLTDQEPVLISTLPIS